MTRDGQSERLLGLERQFELAACLGAPFDLAEADGPTATCYMREGGRWPYGIAIDDRTGKNLVGVEGETSEAIMQGLPYPLRSLVRSALEEMTSRSADEL
jgi:hypothetical protein